MNEHTAQNKKTNWGTSLWQMTTVLFVNLMVLSWLLMWSQWYFQFSSNQYLYLIAMLVSLAVFASFLVSRALVFSKLNPNFSFILALAFAALLVLLALQFIQLPAPLVDPQQIDRGIFDGLNQLRQRVPNSFAIALIVILAWQVGMQLAKYKNLQLGVMAQMRFGLFMILFFAAVSKLYGGNASYTAIFGFLVFTLMGLGISRIALVSHSKDGQKITFNAQWLGGLSAITLSLASLVWGLGFVITLAFNSDLKKLPILITQGLVYLTSLLLSPLLQLWEWLVGKPELRADIPDDVVETLSPIEEMNTFLSENTEFNTAILTFLALVGVAILVVVIFFVAQRNWQRRNANLGMNADDLERSTSKDSGLKINLKDQAQAFQEALKTFREKYIDGLLSAYVIRRTYARFLNLCIDLKLPRKESQTPREFMLELREHLPALENEISILTEAYLKVRYGGKPEEKTEVELVKTAWQQIQKLSKALEIN